MKEIKKPYNVYLIKREDGEEELKFIEGIFEGDYKKYLGLYILTDDETRFPILDWNTGEIYLNENLKKLDDRQKAIENLENYYKNNPEITDFSIPRKQNVNVFFKINDDFYIFDFDLQDQINLLSQIILEFEIIKINAIKNNDTKNTHEFSLQESKNIYKLLYNNLDHNK